MKAQILLFNGFDELDALAPFEVLRNAAACGAEVETELATLNGSEEVVGSHGLRVKVETRIGANGRPDLLIVPGGGWNNRSPHGVWAEYQRGEVPRVIARYHREGASVASVCTGAMLLAAAGLLKDRPATTHHSAVEDLRAAGAQITAARVVDDGDIITAGGVTSGLDLALWLAERFFGSAIAQKVQKLMEYERRDRVWTSKLAETKQS